jgi:hypothetical protein
LPTISRGIEDDRPEVDYRARKARSDCRNTAVYCVISVALLVVAGPINSPEAVITIPGGALTIAVIDIVIVVAVVLLCIWQAPRPR